MTQKELLYIEDAYMHETNIISYLEELNEKIDDEDLLSFIKKEIKSHASYKEKLLDIVKEKTNE